MNEDTALATDPARQLCEFIRSNQQPLIDNWTARVRAMSPARELSPPALVDHMPAVLARIADIVESVHTGRVVSVAEVPRVHAIDRLAQGFDLEEVIREYAVLRQCILDYWEREAGPTIPVSELRKLDGALDQSITESTVNFARAHERMLRAVNRISEAALGKSDLDAFLRELLQATLETMGAVDTAAVLLREDDILRMRAAVGLEEEVDQRFTLPVGEGIAGEIAADGQPILLRHAATDPRVRSRAIRDKGVRALYGVPLVHGAEIVGIAYMGSRTAFEFSDEDMLLFRTMASRATSVIVQAQLVATLQRTVADRDRFVAELATERSRLEQILHQMPVGALIAEASTGKITFVNRRCQDILGQSLSLSEPVSAYPGWKPFRLDGTAYAPDETPCRRALRGEQVADDLKIRRPDGGWVVARATAAPIRDEDGQIQGSVVALDDVSEQRRDEQSLRFLSEASRTLAASLDHKKTLSQIATLVVPALADWFSVELLKDGAITSLVTAHADPAKAKLVDELRIRFPPKVDAAQGLAKVLRSGQPELFREVGDDQLANGAQSAEHLALMRRLGMRSVMVVPLKALERTIGAITFVSTQAGRRYGERDLQTAQSLADRAAVALENARLHAETEAAVHLREKVLAVVSHDLRNPLGVINMSAALLLKRFVADRRVRKHVETVQRAARRMEHLISDLLDMASIQAGRLAIERVPQEIAPVVAEALQFAEPLSDERDIALVRELAIEGVACAIDRDRILQVFANLIGNAQKFSPRRGSITLAARASGDEIAFAVSDTGPGIPKPELSRVFDPYWSAARHAKKGIGLGLYIAKGIVEAHGGRIWVDSGPGSGATFHFTLPTIRDR